MRGWTPLLSTESDHWRPVILWGGGEIVLVDESQDYLAVIFFDDRYDSAMFIMRRVLPRMCHSVAGPLALRVA